MESVFKVKISRREMIVLLKRRIEELALLITKRFNKKVITEAGEKIHKRNDRDRRLVLEAIKRHNKRLEILTNSNLKKIQNER